MSDKSQQDKSFRETLNLPKTDFPMRAGLPKNEPKWVEKWQAEDIYGQLRAKSKSENRQPFILHCGPPYANGNMHLGHALTKTLKDFVVRSQQMAGYDAVFVPGWDCHGLPIEWKVEENFKAKGKTKEDFSVAEIRKMCREFATGWVAKQKEDWRRFGTVADFANPYLTMNYANEAGIVRELGKMAATGLLYKGAKSIMWSTVEETSLAEAEVEYADHESTAVFVKFPVVSKQNNAEITENECVVIWTTTPWTLPANKAVAYGKDFYYVQLKATQVFAKATAKTGNVVWVAQDLLENFTKMTGIEEYEILQTQKGSEFTGWKLKHCFYDSEVPLLEGFHVTVESGTGFVHIAPSHGADDFEIGKQFGLDLFCHVQGNGNYDEEVADLPQTAVTLTGVNIWKAQKLILAEMTANRNLMRWYKLNHSYPISWRSKAPLIFRTTPQWFLALDQAKSDGSMDGETVREVALSEIARIGENNGWIPAYGQNRITAMLENRPDWCISRQRAWGVPITIFRHKPSGEYTFDSEIFEHIASKIAEIGVDAWETLSITELLPIGYLKAKGWQAEDMEKEVDILDVWFDSGTTYAHVVEEMMGQTLPVDLYLEGSDQHRGWFNSSLTACVATRRKAPYKQILTHGFVVDGLGKKMSKSVGNVILPADLLKTYGMDIVRLWVAASDYNEDIRVSDEILKGAADSYRRFRNSFKFLLGNLYDFDEAKHSIAYDDLPELEKYILSKFAGVLEQVQDDYTNYQFNKVFQNLHNFCAKDLSNLYFDIRKDSLYCDAKSGDMSHHRRSCQTVLMALLKGITTYMAPIIPFTTDEVWRTAFGEENAENIASVANIKNTKNVKNSVHLQDFMTIPNEWQNAKLDAKWEQVLEIRRQVNLAVEAQREAGIIGASLEAAVVLELSKTEMIALQGINLEELFIVSEVEINELDKDKSIFDAYKFAGQKCPRCWTYHHEVDEDGLCERCADVLQTAPAQQTASQPPRNAVA